MPFISGRGENLFSACWIAIGGTILVLIATLLVIVEPKKSSKTTQDGKSYEKIAPALPEGKSCVVTPDLVAAVPEPAKTNMTTKATTKILWICCIAGALDSAGDEGTRIARGTVLQNVWPSTNDLMFQNVLLLSLIGMLFLVMALVGIGKATIGLGATAVLGCAATLTTQLLLNGAIIKWEGYEVYILINDKKNRKTVPSKR